MGLFDTLIYLCPICHAENSTQSKAGSSLLNEFYMDDEVPLWLMEDLNGSVETCIKCKKRIKFIFDIEVKLKHKEVVPVDNLDYIEFEYRKRKLKKRKNKLK